MPRVIMVKQKKQSDKIVITILSFVVLILLFSLIAIFIGYQWGKGNGHEQYTKENNAKIQELNGREKSLQTWAQDLSRRESNLNNTEQTISTCYSNLQNLTQNYTECKQKLDNPESYIFNLNYSYNEINVLLISIFIYLIIYLPISLTLFKVIIENKDIRLIVNIVVFVILVASIIVMGIE